MREQADLHQAEIVLIEDKASGTQLIQELSQEGMHSVGAYKLEGSLTKEMRLNAQTGVIENGLVFLPEAAEWLDSYLHEMTTLPAGKYDDQVDSTAQARCTGSRRDESPTRACSSTTSACSETGALRCPQRRASGDGGRT